MIRNTAVIPLKDNIPTRTFPIITVSIIFVNIIIFLWQRFALPPGAAAMLYGYYGLVPHEIVTSALGRYDLFPYNLMTVFTSMFLHGGFLHIIGNMLYLWIFGNNIEDRLGHIRFFFFYFVAGVFAAAFQVFYDPSSEVPMIGASGAVSGVLGAYLVSYPRARVKTLLIIFIFIKIVEIPAVVLLTIWFFMQFLYAGVDGIAWYAHVGGFIFGLVCAWLFTLRSGRQKAAKA